MDGMDEEWSGTVHKGRQSAAASYEMVCNWTQKAWDEIDPEIVTNSFIGCGLVHDRVADSLHSNLKKLVKDNEVVVDEEHTGISDDDETDLEVTEEEEEVSY